MDVWNSAYIELQARAAKVDYCSYLVMALDGWRWKRRTCFASPQELSSGNWKPMLDCQNLLLQCLAHKCMDIDQVSVSFGNEKPPLDCQVKYMDVDPLENS